MKKPSTDRDFQDYLRRRQNFLERHRERREIHKWYERWRHEQYELRRGRTILHAPECFSFIRNTKGVLTFLNKLSAAGRGKRNIFINLRYVTDMAVDGAVLLIARMEELHTKNSLAGEGPQDPVARQILIDSGFFSHVQHALRSPPISVGILKKESQQTVDTDLAEEAVQFAAKTLFGRARRNPALYRTLIECMANTRNHASPNSPGKKRWWLAVTEDKATSRVGFAFVDTGVGIFESAKISQIRRALNTIGLNKNCDILREMLAGTLASRTGLSYRGKGLPSIRSHQDKGKIHRLTMITNDVFADVHNSAMKTMTPKLQGAFLYWDVDGSPGEKWLD